MAKKNAMGTAEIAKMPNDELVKAAMFENNSAIQEELVKRFNGLIEMVSKPQLFYRDDFEKVSGKSHKKK